MGNKKAARTWVSALLNKSGVCVFSLMKSDEMKLPDIGFWMWAWDITAYVRSKRLRAGLASFATARGGHTANPKILQALEGLQLLQAYHGAQESHGRLISPLGAFVLRAVK